MKSEKLYSLFALLGSVTILFLIYKKMSFIKPIVGIITSPFGKRINPITKLEQFHSGIDIRAKAGSLIVSPMDGKVSSVYTNSIGGLQMTVKHINGYTTGYAHLSSTIAKLGQTVKQGEAIALSGDSGRGTGAHLHFTVRNEQGQLINPSDSIYKA